MTRTPAILALVLLLPATSLALAGDDASPAKRLPYTIVDTAQERCYDARREVRYPAAGKAFSGQDAAYVGNRPTYRKLDDGTVLDLVTGLMWTRDPGAKKTFFWTSTTHASARGGSAAVYFAFGRGTGWMRSRLRGQGIYELLDVHGAGCQRSDPKEGDPSR